MNNIKEQIKKYIDNFDSNELEKLYNICNYMYSGDKRHLIDTLKDIKTFDYSTPISFQDKIYELIDNDNRFVMDYSDNQIFGKPISLDKFIIDNLKIK